MPKFKIAVDEIHRAYYEVEAATKQEAFDTFMKEDNFVYKTEDSFDIKEETAEIVAVDGMDLDNPISILSGG